MTKKQIYKKLLSFQELVIMPCEFDYLDIKIDTESAEYEACSFRLDNNFIVFRAAKITPTKIGQFVTLWKRNQDEITAPFHISDDIDFTIICTRRDADFGAFIFPKTILQEKGILSDENKEGKRGFRVYPPWDIAINKQAKQTQEWQLKYFFNTPIETEKVALLFRK